MIIAISIILFLIILYFFAISPAIFSNLNKERLRSVLFAHRGLYNNYEKIPENSIPAFINAVNNGYGIETDIHLTRDKKVVIFHDEDIERMTDKNIDINQIDYEDLQKIKLLNTKESIPLLQDVLDAVSGKVPIMIEFKDIVNYKDLCVEAFKILDGYTGWYCVESFDPLILRWMKLNRRSVIRGQLSGLATKYNNDIKNPFLRAKDFDTMIFEEDNLPIKRYDNKFHLTPHTVDKRPRFWV